jgi:fibronectin type 3 domain-containing protein
VKESLLKNKKTLAQQAKKEWISFYPFFFRAFVSSWLILAAKPLSAQSTTSGADFLKIDSGARSEGMGEAFTAVADDVNALTWNPAGLALLKGPQVGYLRMLYLSDIDYNFGGIAVPLPDGENTWGLGAGVVNLGTSFDSTLGLEPSVSAGDTALFLSGAYRIKTIVSFGASAKYILRNIAGYNASAFAGDASVLITPGDRFRIGAGLFNFGQSVKFISSSDPLPLTGRLGLAYQVLNIPRNTLLLAADGSYDLQAKDLQGAVGAEYWYDQSLALRAGYTGDAYQQHWTAGVGVNTSSFELDYAYSPMGSLGETHRLSLLVRFGGETPPGLGAPSLFTAKPFDSGIELNWKAADSKDLVGYNLYVKKPGALVYTRVTPHPISDTSVKLKNLKNGMNYDFELSSVSAAGRESSKVRISAVPAAPASTPVPAAAPSPVVLAPPTGFRVVSAGVGLSLSWNKSPAPAAGYNLYLAGETGNPPKKMSSKPLVETLAKIKNAVTDKTYRFFLTSVDASGVESAPASAVYVPAPAPTPVPTAVPAAFPAPESFNAVPGDGSASLSWSEVPGAVGYKLYASSDGKAFDLLTPQAKTGLKAILKPLTNGQAYYFAVTALALDGRESAKKIQTVLPAPDPIR